MRSNHRKRVEKLIGDMQEQSEGKKMKVSRRDNACDITIDQWQVYQLQMQIQEGK